MRDRGWILAVAMVVGTFLAGMVIAATLVRGEEEYRRNVNLCATTADTPAEFRACVEAAE